MPKRLPVCKRAPFVQTSISLGALICVFICSFASNAIGDEPVGANQFHKTVRPILEQYCFDCHADGVNKGKVAFDEFKSDQAALEDRELWSKALKNLRAGLMPPSKKSQPTAEEKARVALWIKRAVFQSDPQNPDPGRVTVRRLNRIEYRNTVRDLLGVDFDALSEFPPDDTGYGFDNIGDVLTLPPMLLEKYLAVANKIVAKAVPTVDRVVREQVIPGRAFRGYDSTNQPYGGLPLSFYTPAAVSNTFSAKVAGKYQLALDLMVNEKFVDNVFDYNKCRMRFSVDGKELSAREYSWEGGRPY